MSELTQFRLNYATQTRSGSCCDAGSPGSYAVPLVHRRSAHIDIHGINADGGAQSLSERLRAGNAVQPCILTGSGPLGPWESRKTSWGVPVEQTSAGHAACRSSAVTIDLDRIRFLP
jgi:hypothetical protein